MKQTTLTIQNGHRNALHGAIGTAGEVDLIDKVYYALVPLLQKAGIIVYYEDDGLWDAQGNFTGLLNGDKDYFIALHFDGSTNTDYNGGFIDDSPTDLCKDQSWKLAQTVADHYFSAMGISFRPEHRTSNSTYYYAFNATGDNTKQFLIELGTLTSPHDKPLLQDYGKIARLLSEGIIAYLTQYDDNYKAYLSGQTTEQNKTEIDVLRQQLQKEKDAYDQLADQYKLCDQLNYSLTERIKKIKEYILQA